MPTLKGMLAEAKRGNPLLVTREHAAWLEMSEADRFDLINSERETVMAVLERLIFGKAKVERTKRISASGLGGCLRKQLFSYAGAPAIGEDPDSSDLMSMGTHDHLWWQIEGMVMGWLTEVEPFVTDGFVGGSLDGVGFEVPVFELKTVRESKYTKIVLVDKEAPFDHMIQLDFYMQQLNAANAALVYQERGGGSYHEFWVERRPEIARKREHITEQLGNCVTDNSLPAMLEDCEAKQGTIYRQCPFRKYCPKARTVTVSAEE